MEPGILRHIVTIEQQIETQDTTGAVNVEWQTWQSGVRASIEPLRVREQFEAQQIQADIDTFIRIRYRPGVTEKMRLVHVTQVSGSPQVFDIYDIAGPPMNWKGLNRELHLMCKKRSAEGFRSDGNS